MYSHPEIRVPIGTILPPVPVELFKYIGHTKIVTICLVDSGNSRICCVACIYQLLNAGPHLIPIAIGMLALASLLPCKVGRCNSSANAHCVLYP